MYASTAVNNDVAGISQTYVNQALVFIYGCFWTIKPLSLAHFFDVKN
jgi:hypothetical protein